MAIVFEQKQGFNWKMAITVAVIFVVIGAVIYFLFFTAVPGIQIIVPPTVSSITELSNVEFEPSVVVNSEVFKSLRRYTGALSVGQIGRTNPFVKY